MKMRNFARFVEDVNPGDNESKESVVQRNYRRLRNFGGAVGVGLAVHEASHGIRAGAGYLRNSIQEHLSNGIQPPGIGYMNLKHSDKSLVSFGLLGNNPIHGALGTLGTATGITSAVSDSNAEYENERRRILTTIADPYKREQALKELDSLGSRAKRFSATAQNAAIRGALYGTGAWAGSHAIGKVFGAGRPISQPTGVN